MRVIFLLTIISLFIANVLSLKCYDCDSIHEPSCGEYFYPEGAPKIECDDAQMPEYLHKYRIILKATGCITKTYEGIDGARLFIRRACYFGHLKNTREACEALDPFVPYADILDCQICEDDLCNNTDDASIKLPSLFVILALSLSVILTRIFN